MLAISGDIQIFVLQSGVVLRRLRGVSGRFESGDAGLDAGVAMYALAILAGVLTVLVTRRAVVWYRVLRLLGPEGLGLDKESVTLWWGYLSPVLRQDPARLLSSRERMAAELERLADAGEDALAREVHKAWIEHTPAAQNPRNGLKNLVQTEAIRVRDHKTGRRIFEGYLRRVGQDAVDVVPFKKVGMERMSEGSGHVYLIRARGCGADQIFQSAHRHKVAGP